MLRISSCNHSVTNCVRSSRGGFYTLCVVSLAPSISSITRLVSVPESRMLKLIDSLSFYLTDSFFLLIITQILNLLLKLESEWHEEMSKQSRSLHLWLDEEELSWYYIPPPGEHTAISIRRYNTLFNMFHLSYTKVMDHHVYTPTVS